LSLNDHAVHSESHTDDMILQMHVLSAHWSAADPPPTHHVLGHTPPQCSGMSVRHNLLREKITLLSAHSYTLVHIIF